MSTVAVSQPISARDYLDNYRAKQREGSIHRTANPSCPACQAKRIHNTAEWTDFHPHAGTGRSKQ